MVCLNGEERVSKAVKMNKKTTFFELRAVGKHLKISKSIEIEGFEYLNILPKEFLTYCTKLFKEIHETHVFF